MTLGVVWMWLGFGAAVLVAVLGILGWLVGMALANFTAGNINFSDAWNALLGRRAES
jgi:hypothetical protein